MTATSKWPAVVDALLASFRAVTGLTVYDGPEYLLTSDSIGEFVVIGGNGSRTDPGDPGQIDQEWKGLGAHARDETGSVNGAVIVWSGDTTIKPMRDRAFALLAELETAIVVDPTLAAPIQAGWLLPLSSTPEQGFQKDVGGFCRLPFTVNYRSRLEGS